MLSKERVQWRDRQGEGSSEGKDQVGGVGVEQHKQGELREDTETLGRQHGECEREKEDQTRQKGRRKELFRVLHATHR